MEQSTSLIKRYAACLYEVLSLIAIWLLSAFAFLLVFGEIDAGENRHLLQLTLWLITGFYLIFCWMRNGQTLAMQAWNVKLVSEEGRLLSFWEALLRYCLLTMSLASFGFGFLWAFIDRDQCFLHDRLQSTRLITVAMR